jgi:parvulin-like peptidyl-prolyl isomerase
VEDWSHGIRVTQLTRKLQEYLFGEYVDGHYMANREQYRRVAISQILVDNPFDAQKIAQTLRDDPAAFSSLAMDYSRGKYSGQNGGFVGIRFVSELLPEIHEAIASVEVCEWIEPVQTRYGYHVLRVEKWFPPELTTEVREQILASMLTQWLKGDHG